MQLVKITGKKAVTGEDVRRGFESLNLTEARCEPKPVQAALPIWVGARDERAPFTGDDQERAGAAELLKRARQEAEPTAAAEVAPAPQT